MNTVWEILYARQLPLHYAAPPICEVIFSGSSSPVIVLSEPSIGKVTGLVLGGAGGFTLSWNNFPGALCFNIYLIGGDNVAVPLAQCVQGPFELPEGPFVPPPEGPCSLVVTAITLEGEGPPSDPIACPTGSGSGTFTLVITSSPQLGVSFSAGPADINGASSGVTSTQREYNAGQTVFITASLTYNFSAFTSWLLDGSPYSQNLTTSVQMNSDHTLTAVYACGSTSGGEVPEDFTLTGPTSLGIFSVPPGPDSVLISGDAVASIYDIIYRGGSIQSINPGGCAPSDDCPECCFLPPGCLFKYNSGASNIDVSNSAGIEDHCIATQGTLESLFPLNEVFQVSHTGGSLLLQWNATVTLNGTEFPVTDFECGNSCPQWEVIQGSGLITQPSAWRIRDYDAWASLLMPIGCLDASCPNCTELTSTNFPLETDPNAVEWDGTSNQSSTNHYHAYNANFYVDGLTPFQTDAPDFFPIAIKGFQASLAEVAGPVNEASVIAELNGFQTDSFPPSDVDRYWRFIIYSGNPSGPPIWCGVKAGGSTPVGSYNRVSCGCPASAPACMYLESFE